MMRSGRREPNENLDRLPDWTISVAKTAAASDSLDLSTRLNLIFTATMSMNANGTNIAAPIMSETGLPSDDHSENPIIAAVAKQIIIV